MIHHNVRVEGRKKKKFLLKRKIAGIEFFIEHSVVSVSQNLNTKMKNVQKSAYSLRV